MEITRTVEIEAPAEVVWSVLADVEQWHTWTASITSVVLQGDGPAGVGRAAEVRQPRLPKVTWTITEWEPGRSFTWESTGPGAHTAGVHSVEATGDGTSRATLTIRQLGPVGALVGLVYRRLTERYVDLEAAGLKRRSEERTVRS